MISERVRSLRREQGLKQEEMAEKLETECGPMAAALFEEARAMKEVRNEREEHR